MAKIEQRSNPQLRYSVRMHDLRFSFASFLVNAGYSICDVQLLILFDLAAQPRPYKCSTENMAD